MDVSLGAWTCISHRIWAVQVKNFRCWHGSRPKFGSTPAKFWPNVIDKNRKDMIHRNRGMWYIYIIMYIYIYNSLYIYICILTYPTFSDTMSDFSGSCRWKCYLNLGFHASLRPLRSCRKWPSEMMIGGSDKSFWPLLGWTFSVNIPLKTYEEYVWICAFWFFGV